MHDDDRWELVAYLPASEPVETLVAEGVAGGRAIRRRRWTVLASAASVVAVLATSAVAIFLGPGRSAGPADPVSAASGQPGPSSAPTNSTPASPAQPAAACAQDSRSNDAGARAWAQWVRVKVAELHPQPGPVEWIRICELDFGHGLVAPPHVMNSAIFALPLRPQPGDTGKPTDSLTAVTDRWERLPNQYRTPCRDDPITEHVVCHQRTLADGSRLVQRDFTAGPAAGTRWSAVRGALALSEGDPGGALPLLRRAVGTWQAQDAPHEVAKLNVLIGQACRALADHDGARLQFSAARETFERLGARPDLAQLDRIVAATDAGSETHELTPREIEVLCLIARGKANRAIANELHLSERTVHRHVSNIFTKLGVDSRTAAVAYGIRHRIVEMGTL